VAEASGALRIVLRQPGDDAATATTAVDLDAVTGGSSNGTPTSGASASAPPSAASPSGPADATTAASPVGSPGASE
jgi:hypothetical protein